MGRCAFCGREFKSPQAVRRHLGYCEAYLAQKGGAAPKVAPKVAAPRAPHPGAPPEADPVRAAEDQVRLERAKLELERLERERDAQARNDLAAAVAHARELNRQRIIRDVKNAGVPPWGGGRVPADVRARARAAIEARLSTLPVSELPPPELIAIAEGARDEVYQPVLAAQEAARTEAEARRRQEEQERLDATRQRWEEAARQTAEAARRTEEERRRREAEAERQLREERARQEQAAKKQALVEHGLAATREDLDAHDDLDDEARAELWDRLADQLEERLTGAETEDDVEEMTDALLAEEFGADEPAEDDGDEEAEE